MAEPNLADALGDERYVSLTTFRASGEGVPTPVWFVPQPDGAVLVYTEASSGKVKRLRRNPACAVAACDARGRVHGEEIAATAEVLDGQGREVFAQLRRRYGWQARAFDLLGGLLNRRRRGDAVGLRVTGAARAR